MKKQGSRGKNIKVNIFESNIAEGKSVVRPIQKNLKKSNPTQQEAGNPKG